MASFYKSFSVFLMMVVAAECQMFNQLAAFHNQQNPYGQPLFSFASQVPGSSENTISGYGSTGSNLPPPQPPQVLQSALSGALTPPHGAAPAPNMMSSFMNMVSPSQGQSGAAHGGGAGGAGGHGGQGGGMALPLTGNIKIMVTKWATQLGHKAYYEAHGCVDPTTALHGRHGQMANFAMMMGCNNHQAQEVCQMAQMSHGGNQNTRMRLMMEFMMPQQMKTMMEECLTPSTLMNGFMGGQQHQQQQQQTGFAPPPGAAGQSGSGNQAPVDCSSISPMLMMSPSAAEGIMSPESLENIGTLRNRYFKMTCQENKIMGSLPYRLCCPGHVKPPTMQEAMMLKSMSAGA